MQQTHSNSSLAPNQAAFYLIFQYLPAELFDKRRASKYAKEWGWPEDEVKTFLDQLVKVYKIRKNPKNSIGFSFEECMEVFQEKDILPEELLYEEVESFHAHYEQNGWTYAQGSKRYPLKRLDVAVRLWISRDFSKARANYKKTDRYQFSVDNEWKNIVGKHKAGGEIDKKKIRYQENIRRANALMNKK